MLNTALARYKPHTDQNGNGSTAAAGVLFPPTHISERGLTVEVTRPNPTPAS